jgi:hypothetical protein
MNTKTVEELQSKLCGKHPDEFRATDIAFLFDNITDLKRQLAESQALRLISSSDAQAHLDELRSKLAESRAALAKSEAVGAALKDDLFRVNAESCEMRRFIEVGVECKCDSASFGGYTCPRCYLLSSFYGGTRPSGFVRVEQLEPIIQELKNAQAMAPHNKQEVGESLEQLEALKKGAS